MNAWNYYYLTFPTEDVWLSLLEKYKLDSEEVETSSFPMGYSLPINWSVTEVGQNYRADENPEWEEGSSKSRYIKTETEGWLVNIAIRGETLPTDLKPYAHPSKPQFVKCGFSGV